jgi:hypothetical protein
MGKTETVDKQADKQRGGITGKGFMPGKSGNPNGRPRNEDTLAVALRTLGNIKLPKKLPPAWSAGLVSWRLAGFPEPKTLIELDAAIMWSTSLDGNDNSRKDRQDRMYGKPVQAITGDLNVNATLSFAQAAARMNGRVIPRDK